RHTGERDAAAQREQGRDEPFGPERDTGVLAQAGGGGICLAARHGTTPEHAVRDQEAARAQLRQGERQRARVLLLLAVEEDQVLRLSPSRERFESVSGSKAASAIPET